MSGAAPKRPRRVMWLTSVTLVLAALVLVLRLAGCAESLFYFPTREKFDTPPSARDVSFKTADGLTLHAWLMLPPGASAERPAPAVLHVHGNAGNVSGHAAFSDFLPDSGVAVLVFDYRSYGRSEVGRITRDNLMTDTRAAWECLKSRPEVDPARLGILGVSIGSAFASQLAAESPDARCLCLVAPFATWPRIAHEHLPVIGPILIRSGLDPVDAVTKLGDRPLLVVHGGADTIVPTAHGQAVVDAAAAAGVHAELAIVGGVGHNDLVADERVGRAAVTAFFQRTLVK